MTYSAEFSSGVTAQAIVKNLGGEGDTRTILAEIILDSRTDFEDGPRVLDFVGVGHNEKEAMASAVE